MPPKQDERLTFTFVADGIRSAVAQASAAAGEKAVQAVGGASAAQQLLLANLVDELRLDVMPVLFGTGLRFWGEGLGRLALQKLAVQEVGVRTSLRFRVQR